VEVSKINFSTKSSEIKNDSCNDPEEFKSILKSLALNDEDIEKLGKKINKSGGGLVEENKSEVIDLDIINLLAIFNTINSSINSSNNLSKTSDSSLEINIADKIDELMSTEGDISLIKSKVKDLENIPVGLNVDIDAADIANGKEKELISNEEKLFFLENFKTDADKNNPELSTKATNMNTEINNTLKEKYIDKNLKDNIFFNTQYSDEDSQAPIEFSEKGILNSNDLNKQIKKEVDINNDQIGTKFELEYQPQKGIGDNFATKSEMNNIRNTAIGYHNVESIKKAIIDIQKPTAEGESAFINIKLKPDNLGQLNINLKIEDGDLKAIMFVQNESTKNAILSQIDELSNSLSKQNITISKFEVKVVNENLNFDFTQNQSNFHDNSNGNFNNRQNKHYWNKTRSEDIETVKLLQYKDYDELGVNILA